MENPTYRTAIQLAIRNITSGTPSHELILEIGATPLVLRNVGLPDLPTSILIKTIDKAFFDHGITQGMLERLYAILENPKAIYRSATQAGTCVVLTYEAQRGMPVVVPIHPAVQIGRSRIVNRVASIYGTPSAAVLRWDAEGLVLWRK